MGLDQTLHKKTYVKNWDHQNKDELHEITIKRGGENREDIKTERISHIIEDVAYWRKANSIHKWFVDNCQEGNDNCGEYYISRNKIRELLAIIDRILSECKLEDGKVVNGYGFKKDEKTGENIKDPILEDGKVMTNTKLAEELLPNQEGFFFGGTNYDQYYWEDLEYTKKTLTELLAEEETGDFYYSSSW